MASSLDHRTSLAAGLPLPNGWGLLRRVSWVILLCSAGLLYFGLSGIARADELQSVTPRYERQVVWLIPAVLAFLGATTFSYERLKGLSDWLFVACLPLLVIVLATPPRNGARSWIPLGFFDFQPSELAKLTFIMALAHYLMFRENHRTLRGLLVPFLVMLFPVALILLEPDLGSAMLFVPVLFAMLFAAGARATHLAMIVFLAVAMLPVFWQGMNAEQRSRVTSLFTQVDGGPAPRGDGYHQHQAKQVIALGGVWGSEIDGQLIDEPMAYHLPAGQTDFVFCLVSERFGLWGSLLTIGLYVLLLIEGMRIASHCKEPYGRLVATGITVLLTSQVIINTGMAVGLMPITGITLPLMSYGGSSLLATAIELGLLMNIRLRSQAQLHAEPFWFARR
ncbi:MAG: rod shape-determining protein RodA [Planctomyces sp.]|nr:rod shape-determining protein RodA [Planctomyces sp.]